MLTQVSALSAWLALYLSVPPPCVMIIKQLPTHTAEAAANKGSMYMLAIRSN